MKTTKNLKLPQYTEKDIFDLQDINKAYDNIDKAYGTLDDARKEVVNIKNEILKINATAEIISARGLTTNRPTNVKIGQQFFDINLLKPIWVKQITPSIVWIDANGVEV